MLGGLLGGFGFFPFFYDYFIVAEFEAHFDFYAVVGFKREHAVFCQVFG